MTNHKSAQSNKGDTNDIELYEKVEKLFKLKMSNQGVFIGIKYRGEKRYHWITYDAFLKLRKSIENLIAQETNKARKELLLKLKQAPPIDWLDANASIGQWLAQLDAKVTADKEQVLQNKTNDGGS